MLPAFVMPETTIDRNGESAAISLDRVGGLVLFTLGVLDVIEQESLLLGIYGSRDGQTWSAEPAVEFPERFYTGVSAVVLDLAEHPSLGYVRAQWKVNRWGRGDKHPKFRLYLFAEAV